MSQDLNEKSLTITELFWLKSRFPPQKWMVMAGGWREFKHYLIVACGTCGYMGKLVSVEAKGIKKWFLDFAYFSGTPFCGCSRFQLICLNFNRGIFEGIHAVLKRWSFNLVCLILYLLPHRFTNLKNATKWKFTHLSTGYKRLCYINWFNYKIMIQFSLIYKITF